MIASEIQGTTVATLPVTSIVAAQSHGISFHDVLSALNPLQYLPVIGSIYRAETGDVIPEVLRRAGSMLLSGLLGGPIGLIINIVSTIAEKVTGLDPDDIVAAQLKVTSSSTPPAADIPSPAATPDTSPENPTRVGLTQAQLAAYGVRSDTTGTLRTSDLQGADVLNTIELGRLGKIAAAAYAVPNAVIS
jgi:hypothetical protein